MSVRSMTGFAHYKVQTVLGTLAIDIKSVNSRYMEIVTRLPDELKALEGDIRAQLAATLKRGKMEARLSWMGDAEIARTVNDSALASLLSLQEAVIAKVPGAAPMTVEAILEFPGIVNAQDVDHEQLKREIQAGLQDALALYDGARCREGDALGEVILTYCDQIEATVKELEPKLPLILEHLNAKLQERLTKSLEKTLSEHATMTAEEVRDRIRQEVLLYAIKMDVDEEMKRLLTHITEVRRMIAAGGEVGKKLDFMMQELNREANTLGSKAAAIEMTQTSLSLKVTIEKMREQVQNLL